MLSSAGSIEGRPPGESVAGGSLATAADTSSNMRWLRGAFPLWPVQCILADVGQIQGCSSTPHEFLGSMCFLRCCTYLDFAKSGFVLAAPRQRFHAAPLFQCVFDSANVREQFDIHKTLWPSMNILYGIVMKYHTNFDSTIVCYHFGRLLFTVAQGPVN